MARKLNIILSKLMEDIGVSDQELSKQTFIPVPTIVRLKSLSSSNPTVSTLEPIAEFFSISIDQLIGKVPLPSKRPKSLHAPKGITGSLVPLIEWNEIERFKNKQIKSVRSHVPFENPLPDGAFATIIETISYGVIFRKGCLIIVSPVDSVVEGDFVVSFNKQATIKQIVCEEDSFYLAACNQNINKYERLSKKTVILGKVVETRFSYANNPAALNNFSADSKRQDELGVLHGLYGSYLPT